MQSNSVVSFLRERTGLACGAIPLVSCTVTRPYLLDRHGISDQGTAIMMAAPYLMWADAYNPIRNLSLYAVPRDYHGYFAALSDALLPCLHASFSPFRFVLFADHSPIGEVSAAARAGLGMVGDNGVLITSTWGSFVFLGSVITDAPWEVVAGHTKKNDFSILPRCEGCGACRRACPAACAGDNHTACFSALTQKKGTLTSEEASALSMHPLVWGCDACQLACPHNIAVIKAHRDTPVDFFRKERIICLDRTTLDAMEISAFQARAYAWRGKMVIERNLDLKNR